MGGWCFDLELVCLQGRPIKQLQTVDLEEGSGAKGTNSKPGVELGLRSMSWPETGIKSALTPGRPSIIAEVLQGHAPKVGPSLAGSG